MIERMEYKVIVTHNSQNNELTVEMQYDALFATAYQALEKANKLRIPAWPDKKFHSIDEYFAHMADLYAIDPVYIMLPLNETSFTVDANKRTISNPKITVLQGDQNSEIVTFVIDRYFDYKDLFTAQYTFVQWTLPDGTEGITNIQLKDLNVPGNGKLRLGWPLDNEITSQKGIVKFSLRFCDMGTVEEKVTDPETGVVTKVPKTVVVYSFNTLTSTLTISESLQPKIDPNGANINDPVNEGLFRKSIINSQIYLPNMPIAQTPRFEDPGLDLNQYESLATTVDGFTTLTMKAQAIVTDTGSLSYEWWYKPAEDIGNFNSNTWYPYNTTTKDGVELPGFSALGGTVVDEYKAVVYDGKAKPGEQFYKDQQGTAAGLEDLVIGKTLYEKFTTYTVPTGTAEKEKVKVTGQYKVTASNSIGSNEAREKDSKTCFLVSPADIAFERDGDLKQKEVFPSDPTTGEDLSITLVVNPTSDSTIGLKREFTWNRYTTNPLDADGKLKADAEFVSSSKKPSMDDETKQEGRKHEVVNPGWYQVIVESTLNRQTKDLESTVCKVTSKPVAPKKAGTKGATVIMAYGTESSAKVDPDDGLATYNLSVGKTAELDVNITNVAQSGYDPLLFSEGVSYLWGVQINDGKSSYRTLTDKDVGPGKLVKEGLGTNKLTIYRDTDEVTYTYKCIITNHLNGLKASCSQADALAFIIR